MDLRHEPGRLIAGAACLLALALGAGTATGQETPPAESEAQPKTLGVQAFIVPAKKGPRVGALLVARYPSLDGELPERARAQLEIFNSFGEPIASARDRGSVPFRKNKNSYLYLHLLSFPREEGKAIIALSGKSQPRARLGASWILNAQWGGVWGGGSGGNGALNFAKQPSVPEVVKTCPVGPYAQCERTSLKGANLKGADLRGAQLDQANLSGANLEDANLNGADLIEANVERANLRRASLEGADAFQTDLDYADLSNANISRLKLIRASVHRTDLTGARFTGIDYTDTQPSHTICPNGTIAIDTWQRCWS
jgi:hypothetical protein